MIIFNETILKAIKKTNSHRLQKKNPAIVYTIRKICHKDHITDAEWDILEHFVNTSTYDLCNTVYMFEQIYSPCKTNAFTYNISKKGCKLKKKQKKS